MKTLYSRWLVVAGCLLAGPVGAPAQILINGTGATFPNPLYSKWFDEYAKVDPTVRFNYQPIGSGGGQKQILAQTVDFGGSDGPMSAENLAKAPGRILQLPMVAGAVAVVYNLSCDGAIRLDGPTLADIFLGKIEKWDDSRIVRLNPAVKLPHADLMVVHRSDGSGTTFIFTDYLSAVSHEWETHVGRNVSVRWPAGLGAKGSDGVAGQVRQLPGAISYVEMAYARQNHLSVAPLRNAAGSFIVPSTQAVMQTLAAARVPDDFRFSMVNLAGEQSYPIASATWLLVYERQKDRVKGRKLVEFLNWAVTEGERIAPTLGYTPLPRGLQTRVLERIKTIQY